MATNAGVPAVAVGYGAHPAEELLRLAPLALAESVAALEEWLAENA
jgi:phosphoglycolate phosphatase